MAVFGGVFCKKWLIFEILKKRGLDDSLIIPYVILDAEFEYDIIIFWKFLKSNPESAIFS